MTRLSSCDEHADLPAEHRLGLPRLALGLGLADARDHVRGPAASAASVRRATVSSVSPKSWRRSEWPTIVP